MMKHTKPSRVEGRVANAVKGIYEKSTADMFNGERLYTPSLRLEARALCNSGLGVLTREN